MERRSCLVHDVDRWLTERSGPPSVEHRDPKVQSLGALAQSNYVYANVSNAEDGIHWAR